MTTLTKAQEVLVDVHNTIWKKVSDLHKSGESDAAKRSLLASLALISDAVDLARFLIEEVEDFTTQRINGQEFLGRLQEEKIKELVAQVGKFYKES